MSRIRELSRRLALVLLGNPVAGVGAQLSLIVPADGAKPTPRLLDLALAGIQSARQEDLSELARRMTTTPRWPEIWPGEHYQFLAGLVSVMAPRTIVEIGTYQGLGALSLAKNLPPGGVVHTFDIVPHRSVAGSILRDADFESGRLRQIVADLTRREVFEQHRALLESAQLLFVDAAKDGKMEQVFLDKFETLRFREPPLVVFDDVRVWNMLRIWQGVRRPKLDLVSFGHWSGTGLIDWQ